MTGELFFSKKIADLCLNTPFSYLANPLKKIFQIFQQLTRGHARTRTFSQISFANLVENLQNCSSIKKAKFQ